MKTKFIALVALAAAALSPKIASAQVFIEQFEDVPFGTWESNWLGTQTNLMNYYVASGNPDINNRGNNPDGLWIADGLATPSDTTITFNSAFGNLITEFSFDATTFASGANVQIFDKNGASILNTALNLTSGAYSDPGVYQNFSLTNINGLSSIVFTANGSIEGNTSIDNVRAVLNREGVTPVPEPSTYGMLGAAALAGVVMLRRRRR